MLGMFSCRLLLYSGQKLMGILQVPYVPKDKDDRVPIGHDYLFSTQLS